MPLVAPSPLPSRTPLFSLVGLAGPGGMLGAWVRGGRHVLRLQTGCRAVLAGPDLGTLLRRCARIIVQVGPNAVVVGADVLIAWRTLRIVTGCPFLPELDRLRSLVPSLEVRGPSLAMPIGLDSPEEALAACVSAGVSVVASWIEYRR